MVWEIIGLSLLFIIIGYLLGNILFGLLISKIKKVDVRSQGSGNIGATNISRVLGKRLGILVLIFDMFKGWFSIFICSIIYQTLGHQIIGDDIQYQKIGIIIYLSGLFVVIGHCFPIFYLFTLFKTKFNFEKAKEFSGGKGAASTAGVFTAISPWVFLIAFLVFVVIFLSSRFVSLSSMIAISIAPLLFFIPILDYFYILKIIEINPILSIPNVNEAKNVIEIIGYKNDQHWEYILSVFIITNLISIIVVFKHKDNIKRLASKQEKPLFNWKNKKNTHQEIISN